MLEIKGRTVILLLKTDLQFFTFINLRETESCREGRRSPRRIDSQHGDESQGDPAVETPLVDGSGEADDAHEQELVVLKVLLRHLEEEHIPDSLKSNSEEKLIREQTEMTETRLKR